MPKWNEVRSLARFWRPSIQHHFSSKRARETRIHRIHEGTIIWTSEITSKSSDHFGLRWARWLATVTLVLVFSILLLPFFRRFPEWIHTWFAHQPPWQRILSVFLFSSVSVSILFNVLSPRIAHLRAFWLHPPVWSAWAVGILLACIGDLIF
jgi:hypothetical protein